MDISTQTDFNSITESTQTELSTNEMACQTDIDTQDPSKWKLENPLKRKLLITLAFDPKVAKNDKIETNNSLLISNETNDSLLMNNETNDSLLMNNDHNYTSVDTPNTCSVTCQPDIATIIPKSDNQPDLAAITPKTTQKEVKTEKPKKSKKETKDEANKKKKKKKNAAKKKADRSILNDTSDSDEGLDYNTLMANRLEEAIKLIQQQWSIHEKRFRKNKTGIDDTNLIEDPIEKLQVKQGRAYGNELKFLALNLFYSNSIAYKALRQHLNLPTEKTLRRIEVGLSTKLTPTVINCLRVIVNRLSEEEKFCVVCANMLPLKEEVHKMANSDTNIGYHEINGEQGTEIASKTLVVLVQGLYSDWKQPLITCYLKEHFDFNVVNAWLDQIIETLLEIGLRVMGFTTNENVDLLNMAKQRSISTERPYFFINTHKIYYIFDIMHLMMSLRDLLIHFYFRYLDVDGTEQIVSWFDIEKLFETDKNRSYKLAPKLTENHIRPNDLEKKRVQYALQVFSKTVANGVMNCIEQKHLTARSFGTVKFVELFNNLFDILNSHSEKERYKIPFCFKDYQIDVLNTALNVVSNLKVISKNYEDTTSSVETMKCIEITIKSVLNLASDLKNYGFCYLRCKNLNLQHLDLFFESIRRKWGSKATTVLFYAGFRNFFLENVIKKSENNDSCGLDKELISILLKDNSSESESENKDEKDLKDTFNPYFKFL